MKLAEGLILTHWDMSKAQGLRPKDKMVELHMKLSDLKTLIFQRFGKKTNCLGVNENLFDAFEKVPNKNWTMILENLGEDQILIGTKNKEEKIYYCCVTVYELEK